MPLKQGSSRKVISENIDELTHHGSRPRSHAQIVAIALSEADKSRHQHRAMGGINTLANMRPVTSMSIRHSPALMKMPKAPHLHLADGGFQLNDYPPWQERAEARELAMDAYHPSGLFQGSGAGRTDRLPRAVAVDSFVMPADIISGLGEGATAAGANIMNAILASATGPYGASMPHGGLIRPLASGGSAGGGVSHVMVASGEFLYPRNGLMNIGWRRRNVRAYHRPDPKVDLAEGHKWARDFVKRHREHQMKFLKNAPSPKR